MGNQTNALNSRSDWLKAWLEVLSRNPLERTNHTDQVIYVESIDYPDGADTDSWITVLEYLAPDGYAVVPASCNFDRGLRVWYGEWVKKSSADTGVD